MQQLQFTCPETNQRTPTGIKTDVQSLRAMWSQRIKVACPHCGTSHEMLVYETYLEAALQDVFERIR
jgi:hypothetical protein